MASFYARGFHLGRQLLQPSHSHAFNSGPAYTLFQAGSSIGQQAQDEEKRRKKADQVTVGNTGSSSSSSSSTSAPPTSTSTSTSGSSSWQQWAPRSSPANKYGVPSSASIAAAFPSRLSSPAASPNVASTPRDRPSTADPLANLGLDMLLRSSDLAGPAAAAVDFDPFGEEHHFAFDAQLVGAMVGTATTANNAGIVFGSHAIAAGSAQDSSSSLLPATAPTAPTSGPAHPQQQQQQQQIALARRAALPAPTTVQHQQPRPIQTASQVALPPLNYAARVAAQAPKDHSDLIKQLGKEGGWDKVRSLWEDFERRGVKVDLATRNAYLEHLGRHPSRLPTARAFFTHLPLQDRNLATYNVMVKMHSVALLPDLAKEYYDAISLEGGAIRAPGGGWVVSRLQPNVVSRTHLLDAYARTGQLAPALSTFHEILSSRPAPSPDQLRVAYKHLLVAHVNAGDPTGARTYFDLMRQDRRIPADPFTYALMISHSPNLSQSHSILQSYPGRMNLQIYEALISAHASQGDQRGAWQWYARLLAEGNKPSSRTWRVLARAVMGDHHGVLGLEEEMVEEEHGESVDVMMSGENNGELKDAWGVLSSLGMDLQSAKEPAEITQIPGALASIVANMESATLRRTEQERVLAELQGVVSRTKAYRGLEGTVRGIRAALAVRTRQEAGQGRR